MYRNQLTTLAACLLVMLSMTSRGEESASTEAEPVPGQLDIIERTAVSLDGRPPDGVEATSFRWSIVEGEGGQLFGADQEDAVFVAPAVERGVKQFLIELTVTYVDQPPSTRRLRIRVLPTDPAAAQEGSAAGDTQWIEDHYRRAREAEEEKKRSSSSPTFGTGRSGPSVSIGVAGGTHGTRGGIGIRWSMSYPLAQPVDVPPPGQSRMPGEGTWDVARPVPRDQLSATFPPEIAERYRQQPEEVLAREQPDQVADPVALCEEHLNSTYSVRLDAEQRECVRQGIESGGDCDDLLNRCADVGKVECLAWIDETYRIDSMMRALGLELAEEYEAIRRCVGRDARRMALTTAIKACDSVFKVHCPGLDLLNEIAEAQVEQCERQVGGSLGLRLDQYRGWRTCAQHKVFDRYVIDGESSDERACEAAFLEECGTNIDDLVKAGNLSPEQRSFVECCSADRLDARDRGDSDPCRTIDDGFEQGPCHSRPVCVNRLTNEWIPCR